MSFYRLILKQAWKNTFKYKYLWIFGLFAALTAAGSSWEYSLFYNGFSQNIIDSSYLYLENLMAIFETVRNLGLGFIVIFQSGILGILSALTVIILSLTLVALVVWLAVSSQGALINSLKEIIEGKKNRDNFEFRKNITVGHKSFWPVLAMNIIIKLFITAVFIIISVPLLILVFKNTFLVALIYIILFVLFIPFVTGFSLMMKYAISYQIFEKEGLIKSIKKAYNLFKKNWLISLEMSVILFIISFLASLTFLILASIILAPLFITGIFLYSFWLSYLAVLLGIIALIFFGTLLSTFQISAWTGLFMELKKTNGLIAKLERLFQKN